MRHRWSAISPEAELRSAGQTGRLPLRKNKKRDRQFGPFGFGVRGCLFNVDGLAVGIKASLDANFLAFVLFQRFLMINIVGLAAGVLENVLVACLGDGAAKGLAVVGRWLRLGIVARLAGRWL